MPAVQQTRYITSLKNILRNLSYNEPAKGFAPKLESVPAHASGTLVPRPSTRRRVRRHAVDAAPVVRQLRSKRPGVLPWERPVVSPP
jgi:hypothetical protein